MRPSWTGIVRISAVDIAVKLFPATEELGVSLTGLHSKDLGTVTRIEVCDKCTHPIEAGDKVKAIAVGKDGHVVLSAEDLAEAAPASRDVIVLDEFIPLSEIPLEYFEKSYFVAGTDSAYGLLHLGLVETGLAGIGKVAFPNGRERICAIAIGNQFGPMLYVLRFAGEVRHLDPAHSMASDELLSGFKCVLEQHRGDGFHPERYTDEYSAKLVALGEERAGKPRVDLAAAIEASGGSVKPKARPRVRRAQ